MQLHSCVSFQEVGGAGGLTKLDLIYVSKQSGINKSISMDTIGKQWLMIRADCNPSFSVGKAGSLEDS